jgi:Ca2+-binding EF-hand superfamily protein
MGSCQILRPIKSSTKSNLSNRGESTRNSQSVTSSETFFLTQIFQELCTRNHSSKSLEKNIFLIFFSFRGLLGERIFDFYDKDKDGYINQDEFLSIVEKFTKSPVEEVSKDLFLITDLKSDSLIDSEEFLKIVKST